MIYYLFSVVRDYSIFFPAIGANIFIGGYQDLVNKYTVSTLQIIHDGLKEICHN